LLVKYPSDETQKSIELRLSEHLKTLRRAMIHVELDAIRDEDPPRPTGPKAAADNPRQMAPIITLAEADCRKIARRAKRLIERREAASGLAHLKREDKERLSILRDGVNLIRLPSEHRADEIAADLHDEFPWMARVAEIGARGLAGRSPAAAAARWAPGDREIDLGTSSGYRAAHAIDVSRSDG
jgi:hypothetical protein